MVTASARKDIDFIIQSPVSFNLVGVAFFYETSIFSPSPQDTSYEPSNQNSKNLTHEQYDPSNDTVDLINHIANTNNKQLTPYLST